MPVIRHDAEDLIKSLLYHCNSKGILTTRLSNFIPITERDRDRDISWDHPYITSAKGLGGWDQKNGNFC